ncbi:MAG: hypothetical protein GX853_00960 [Chloroflexi bacterium]|nr:hypothetical protein [Chloroflexota bacterium]
MNITAYIFGWLLASLFGALFHLWRDGGFGKLLLYLLLSWVGFYLGHLVFLHYEVAFMQVGGVQMAGGILGSLVFLFLGHWFTHIQPLEN